MAQKKQTSGKLEMLNANRILNVNLTTKPTDTTYIDFVAKISLSITSMVFSPNLTVLDSSLKILRYPANLDSGQLLELFVVAHPTPATYDRNEYIVIKTNEESLASKILVDVRATQLSTANSDGEYEINLSKSKDKYLIITGEGSVNTVSISRNGTIIKEYTIWGQRTEKISLADVQPGKYTLTIWFEEIGVGAHMTVTK